MKTKWWIVLGAGALLVASRVAAQDAAANRETGPKKDPKPAGVAASQATEDQWSYWFFVLEEYRLRAAVGPGGGGGLTNPVASDESDHDLRFFLESGARDPSDRFGAELALGLWLDVDRSVPDGEPSSLGSIYDYRQPWWDVFALQADYRSPGLLKLARAGRQASEHGLPVTFDGASFLLSGMKPYLDFFVFGGRSVHFFEIAAETFEDWVASVGAVARPLKNLRIELDYRFYREDVLQPDRQSKDDLIDHSYGLAAWFRHQEWFYAKAYLRGLDDSLSHTGASARLQWLHLGLGASLDLDAQLVTLREINEREDPFYALLGESLPHLRWRLDLWKRFETQVGDFAVHAGWNGRDLLRGEAGSFNRNVGRIYFLGQVEDLALPGTFVSVAVEGHYTHADGQLSDDMILTAGGSAGYAYKNLKAEAGSYYQRYKYDYYRDLREVEDVRTFYGVFSYKPLDWLTLKTRYEFERSDRDVHTVTLTVSQAY